MNEIAIDSQVGLYRNYPSEHLNVKKLGYYLSELRRIRK